MKTAKLYFIGLVAIIIFTCSQQTFAQCCLVDFYTSPGYTRLINNWTTIAQGHADSKRNSGGSRSTPANQSKPYEVPDYRKYPDVQFKSTGTRLMVQDRADFFGKTPQEKADWKELISAVLDKYEAAARAKGYPNDLALAYVSFIGLNKLMYHGIKEKPLLSFEQNTGLRDVVAKYATDYGTFSNLTDREKQQLYEVFVIYGAVFYQLYELALEENNTEALRVYKLRAADSLEFARIKP
jgi:hypothetical protein